MTQGYILYLQVDPAIKTPWSAHIQSKVHGYKRQELPTTNPGGVTYSTVTVLYGILEGCYESRSEKLSSQGENMFVITSGGGY